MSIIELLANQRRLRMLTPAQLDAEFERLGLLARLRHLERDIATKQAEAGELRTALGMQS